MNASIQHTSDVASFLNVGMVILFHPEVNRKSSRRYKSVVRGWRENGYIMMDRPRLENNSYLMLRDGQDCLIRYTLEGKACGFVGQVLDFEMSRTNASMRVRWPGKVQYTYFRRGERIKCDIRCDVQTEAGHMMEGHIVDLSQGGCGLQLNKPLETNARLELSMFLPDGAEIRRLPSVVCNVRKSGAKHLCGLRFDEGNPSGLNDLAFFVASRLAIERGQSAPQNFALVVDHDEPTASAIAKTLARKGGHCTVGNTVVDAFYRFRTMRPRVVAISLGFEELPAADVVRLLKADGIGPGTPIVLYGGEGENLEQVARAAGADQYVPPCKTLGPDVGFALAKLVQGSD